MSFCEKLEVGRLDRTLPNTMTQLNKRITMISFYLVITVAGLFPWLPMPDKSSFATPQRDVLNQVIDETDRSTITKQAWGLGNDVEAWIVGGQLKGDAPEAQYWFTSSEFIATTAQYD